MSSVDINNNLPKQSQHIEITHNPLLSGHVDMHAMRCTQLRYAPSEFAADRNQPEQMTLCEVHRVTTCTTLALRD